MDFLRVMGLQVRIGDLPLCIVPNKYAEDDFESADSSSSANSLSSAKFQFSAWISAASYPSDLAVILPAADQRRYGEPLVPFNSQATPNNVDEELEPNATGSSTSDNVESEDFWTPTFDDASSPDNNSDN